MSRHEEIVSTQFGPQARAYVESSVHATGEDLKRLAAIAAERLPRRALDLGCGGGHVTYTLAKYAETVVACDPSEEMLTAVKATAAQKGLHNLVTQQAAAERLPFGDSTFDFLTCRYSAHHWASAREGLRQARRVLQQGGSAVFIDACAPANALLDTHLQTVELLRDVSHVRDYTTGEWVTMLEGSGFRAIRTQAWRLRMDFETWTARMRTPDLNRQMISSLQAGAAEEVRSYFAIERDGSFWLPVMMIEAEAF